MPRFFLCRKGPNGSAISLNHRTVLVMGDLIEQFGHGPTLALGGGMIGLLFGFFAQRSRFCLRAAA